MGMYDTIEVNYPLIQPENPKGYTPSTFFQTKHLYNALIQYKIEPDGTFWKNHVDYNFINNGIKQTNRRWLPEKITDTIQMHDFVTCNTTDYDYWIKYEVTIVEGNITDVKLLEFTPSDNFTRKQQELEYVHEYVQQSWEWELITQTARYKYIYRPYNVSVSFVFKYIKRFFGLMSSLFYKISRSLNKLEQFILIRI